MGRTRTLLASVVVVTIGVSAPGSAQTREFSETVPLESGGSLRLEASKGSVTVTAWEREEVEIRARIEAPREVSDDYARRAVDATTVDVTGTSRSVRVRSNYEGVPTRAGFWDWDSRTVPSIHYEIRAPRKLSLSVRSDRGPTSLAGFEGRIELDADRGEVDLRDLTGEIRLVIDRGQDSTLSVIRGSFDLEADRTNVRMREVRIEDDSRLDIDRGDAEIDLAAAQGLTLRTDLSRRADFDSELPLTLGSLNGRSFDGTINGGGPELFIESDRGSVRLTAAR